MKYHLKREINKSILRSCNDIVTTVNKDFINLTGFNADELIGKTISEVGCMLRINYQRQLDSILSNYCGFIFSKCLEAIEVYISFSYCREANEKIYTFVEKSNSRLNNKFVFSRHLFIENVIGNNIFSVPDLILLKINNKYMDFLNTPYSRISNSIAKPIQEIVKELDDIPLEALCKKVILTGEAVQIKEYKCDFLSRGVSYWNSTLTPIFENGKMKYIFQTVTDVSDLVIKRQKSEEQIKEIKHQQELLCAIQNVSDAIISTDTNFIIKGWNHAAELIYGWTPEEAIGKNVDVLLKTTYIEIPTSKMIKQLGDYGFFQIEGVSESKCGHIINMHKTVTIIKGNNDDILGFVSILKDITNQKRTQNLAHAMLQVRELIHSTLNFDQIMNSIILEGSKAIKGDSAAISLCQNNNWIISYIHGLPPKILGAQMKDIEALSAAIFLESNKPIVIKDAFNDNRVNSDYMKKHGIRSILVVPLLAGEKIIGAVFFNYSKHSLDFHESDIDFAENLASSLSLALQNVKLYEDVCKELAERNRLQEELRKQKNELEVIIENMSDGVSILDDKGQFVLFNKNSRETFFPPADYLGTINDWYSQSELLYFNGEKVQLENIPNSRVMRGEKFSSMHLTAKYPNKTIHLDISGTPIYDSNGAFSLGVICSRDMTNYVNNQNILKNRYEFLNRMIDTLDLPVIRLSSPDLTVLNINQKAFNISTLIRSDIKSTSQIKGNRVSEVFPSLNTSTYYTALNTVIQEKKTIYIDNESHSINGNDMYWNIIFEPILELDGQIQEILVLTIDVTNEIKSNKLMEKTLKMQEEFIANISHELKTPLNVIYSTVQLFNMYCTNGSLYEKRDSIARYTNSVIQNCYRLSKLINNIVDISKIEAGFFELNLSNNNVVEVVEEVVTSVIGYTSSKGLHIVFDTDTEEKIIACDPEKIERIVLNLISNAIKFSDEGNEILVSLRNNIDSVEISVQDNGIGIKNDELDIIFSRFRQVDKSLSRNAEGTGIGLSLVKSIVELHGGEIRVESELGKGSKFTVMLPNITVMQEKMVLENKLRNKNENTQVELSDIYLYYS